MTSSKIRERARPERRIASIGKTRAMAERFGKLLTPSRCVEYREMRVERDGIELALLALAIHSLDAGAEEAPVSVAA